MCHISASAACLVTYINQTANAFLLLYVEIRKNRLYVLLEPKLLVILFKE